MLKAAAFGFAATLILAGAAEGSVVISTAKTSNMNCSAGVCSPTAANAVLNRRDLGIMLRASDVKVTTGAGATAIGILSPLTWANAHRLTLDAQHSVSIRAAVIVKGPGGLTITLEDGASGAFNFYPGGSVTFWDTASSFVVNGNTYTLVNDIATLAADVAFNPSGFYALANDYDAAGGGERVSSTFDGAFEGLGHVVENLALSGNGGLGGMFESIGSAGSVRDIGLTNGQSACSGLLAYQNAGRIENSFATGTANCTVGGITAGLVVDNIGTIDRTWAEVDITVPTGSFGAGLVGENEGTISSSFASGAVSGDRNASVGGLVTSSSGVIELCHATGNVSAPGIAAGGLVAVFTGASGVIRRSYATGSVSGAHYAGGLVGQNGEIGFDNGSLIEQSFSTGAVSGTVSSGGLVGLSSRATAANSYATGSVSGGSAASVGGLIGKVDSGTVANSYSTGIVSGGKYTGGFSGAVVNQGKAPHDYWDLDTSGISDPTQGVGSKANYPGVTGLSDAQMKAALPAGFSPSVWGLNPSINNGYPYLLANPPQ